MKLSRVGAGTLTLLAAFLLAAVACNDSSPTAPSSGASAAETIADTARMPIVAIPYRHIAPRQEPTTPTRTPTTPTPPTTPTRTATPTPTPTKTTPTPTPPAAVKYDGTYDFTIYGCSLTDGALPCVGNQAQTFARVFVVLNGNITVGPWAGAVTDSTFGTVRLMGPCPVGDGTSNAVFTGTLNAGTGTKFGQGQYMCNGGLMNGYSNAWQVFNGQ